MCWFLLVLIVCLFFVCLWWGWCNWMLWVLCVWCEWWWVSGGDVVMVCVVVMWVMWCVNVCVWGCVMCGIWCWVWVWVGCGCVVGGCVWGKVRTRRERDAKRFGERFGARMNIWWWVLICVCVCLVGCLFRMFWLILGWFFWCVFCEGRRGFRVCCFFVFCARTKTRWRVRIYKDWKWVLRWRWGSGVIEKVVF